MDGRLPVEQTSIEESLVLARENYSPAPDFGIEDLIAVLAGGPHLI